MAILGKERLIKALSESDINKRLVITPLLSETQISAGSIDIRLGNKFITMRRGNLLCLDPGKSNMSLGEKGRFEHTHHLKNRQKFYLHPNELVLAATLEFFKLPTNIGGYVTSRSSWGRAGLTIATAVAVHAGFIGTITLELVNVGEVPLVLYPGLPVAQFVFSDSDGESSYDGRFQQQIQPQSSKSKSKQELKDLQYWCGE